MILRVYQVFTVTVTLLLLCILKNTDDSRDNISQGVDQKIEVWIENNAECKMDSK